MKIKKKKRKHKHDIIWEDPCSACGNQEGVCFECCKDFCRIGSNGKIEEA